MPSVRHADGCCQDRSMIQAARKDFFILGNKSVECGCLMPLATRLPLDFTALTQAWEKLAICVLEHEILKAYREKKAGAALAEASCCKVQA